MLSTPDIVTPRPMGQVSADRIGINATDLNCLNIVALTGHMTAGDLARQTGLSTASITGVLDRLEEGALSGGCAIRTTGAG